MLQRKKIWITLAAAVFVVASAAWAFGRGGGNFPNLGSQKAYHFGQSDAENKSLAEYYQQAQVLGKNPEAPKKISFFAAGDIMLSRNVAKKIKDSGNPAAPFAKIREVLGRADFAFGNLESPIVPGSGIVGGKTMVFAAASTSLAGLAENNFQVVSLANNHALDQGVKGLESTIGFLDSLGIGHVGAGLDQAQAWSAEIIEKNGIATCFLGSSYTSLNDNGRAVTPHVARMEDGVILAARLKEIRPACDFIVVSMHAGTEYVREPNRQQTDFARAAIDAGADMVIGHHPHWIQTVEKYRGKYIFYSLGNFVFDQMWSQDTREGLLLKVSLAKNSGAEAGLKGPGISANLVSVELVPVIIEDYSAPRPATPEESKGILKKIELEDSVLY